MSKRRHGEMHLTGFQIKRLKFKNSTFAQDLGEDAIKAIGKEVRLTPIQVRRFYSYYQDNIPPSIPLTTDHRSLINGKYHQSSTSTLKDMHVKSNSFIQDLQLVNILNILRTFAEVNAPEATSAIVAKEDSNGNMVRCMEYQVLYRGRERVEFQRILKGVSNMSHFYHKMYEAAHAAVSSIYKNKLVLAEFERYYSLHHYPMRTFVNVYNKGTEHSAPPHRDNQCNFLAMTVMLSEGDDDITGQGCLHLLPYRDCAQGEKLPIRLVQYGYVAFKCNLWHEVPSVVNRPNTRIALVLFW